MQNGWVVGWMFGWMGGKGNKEKGGKSTLPLFILFFYISFLTILPHSSNCNTILLQTGGIFVTSPCCLCFSPSHYLDHLTDFQQISCYQRPL